MSINVEWETFKIKFGHFTEIRIAANWCTMFLFFFSFFSSVLKFPNFIEKNHGKMCATQRHVHCFVILIRIRYAFRIRLDIIVVESIQFFFVVVVIVVEHTMCDRQGTDERQQKMFSWFWYSVFLKRSTL